MNVLIIEDEIMAQKSLTRALKQNFPDINIIEYLDSVKGTVEWLRVNGDTIDVIFMDVELSDGVCFEIFKQVEVKAHVIMTTAYDSYALKAFEAGSVDYLLKPIEAEPLKRAVARCKIKRGGIDVEALLKMIGEKHNITGKEHKERYIVRFNDRIIPLNVADIAFIYSEDKNNYLVTFDGKKYIIDSSLDVMNEELNPNIFFKISRSCIVAMNAIKSIIKQPGGRLRIDTNPTPPYEMTVSRSRVDDFLDWLER
jgi:DNA-binding LytR/AlgR family response regulator